MRMESTALCELSSHRAIEHDSTLKYSCTKPERGHYGTCISHCVFGMWFL